MQPTVICVLRRGGEYKDEHVGRLRAQVNGAPFFCLDDVRMVHRWPGWWSKIEMFRFQGPYLYIDLDTLIVDDLAPLLDAATKHDFIALRDFNSPNQMGSGLMAWRGDMTHLYTTFASDPEAHMARCNTRAAWGDQGFLDPLTRDFRVHWQDILPGAVVSWKKHCKDGIPDGAKVVCFHGRPRPWDVGL